MTGSTLYDLDDPSAKVVLKATCSIVAPSPKSAANCDAFMDPVFSFDQPAFDAIMGQSTFLLDDYFDIVYTPVPLSAQVPVPGSMASFGTAIAIMGLFGWRKGRSRA